MNNYDACVAITQEEALAQWRDRAMERQVEIDRLLATQARVEALDGLLKIQCSDGNWNYDRYMFGMANGMIVAQATILNVEAVFLTAPKEWLRDQPTLEGDKLMSDYPQEPHVRMRPRLFIDGNQWCALYGENLQDGVAGFGDSPAHACAAFDQEWCRTLPAPVMKEPNENPL